METQKKGIIELFKEFENIKSGRENIGLVSDVSGGVVSVQTVAIDFGSECVGIGKFFGF
jgi:hypothetical protein